MPGLYVHIPFCIRKCDYCAFYSEVSADRNRQQRFFQSLEKELGSLPANFVPETVFIGGGTPTAPDFQALEKFFPMFVKFSPLEFSVEVNPGTVDVAKLSLLKRIGVNRLSIGVQSFESRCLETLGRIHSAEQADEAFRRARAAGFDNISIDLMFGIPGQTMQALDADLDRALAFGPEHISIYNLMYEEGTPLLERNPVRLDEEMEREMYDHIRERLKEAGFEHYEISNFAKPGFECRHNLLYWTGGEYIGCGPAAHSHWNGTRWANAADLDDYCVYGPRREFEETLDPVAKERETLVMGLRLINGVDVDPTLFKKLQCTFQSLENEGLLEIDGCRVRLSEDALFVSDAVFAELI
ncbi:radical SAM family heme chaperone HemW [Tichowtungia aerotolerans]|uniref:Heme chaperone HemW n=1 Tax=Tichowtungia aerotolerans TaxID=2697043 RepID=A0A6P1MCU0_9BACT|nr:radical SAM family heme chaperone HemW [Tichowtungia aerotolerans]QHI69878.1 radical SAM family heme chaperone HemW [Tichowtungia aerotolerans]